MLRLLQMLLLRLRAAQKRSASVHKMRGRDGEGMRSPGLGWVHSGAWKGRLLRQQVLLERALLTKGRRGGLLLPRVRKILLPVLQRRRRVLLLRRRQGSG